MTDILVRIQHHPSRAALLPGLLGGLGELPVEVITDPRPDELASALRTQRECVGRPHDASHLVVLQDDAIVCHDFEYAVRRAVELHPNNLIALWVGGAPRRSAKEIHQAYARGEPFVLMNRMDWVPTVGLAWPAEEARHFAKFLQRLPAHYWADDSYLGNWCSRYRKHVVATVPSLVEHPDTELSLLDRRPDHKGRKTAQAGKSKARVAAVWDPNFDPHNWA